MKQKSYTKKELTKMMINILGIKPKSINPWFDRKNEAFDGLTPNQLLKSGQSHLIYDMIEDMASGNPT